MCIFFKQGHVHRNKTSVMFFPFQFSLDNKFQLPTFRLLIEANKGNTCGHFVTETSKLIQTVFIIFFIIRSKAVDIRITNCPHYFFYFGVKRWTIALQTVGIIFFYLKSKAVDNRITNCPHYFFYLGVKRWTFALQTVRIIFFT